jgi:hypothetical protein
MLRPLVVVIVLVGIVVYLFISDTLPAVRRYAANPTAPISPLVPLRLSLCGLAIFPIVPLVDIARAFGVGWYWLLAPTLLLGFKSGQWWELLKRFRLKEPPKEPPATTT